NVIVNPTFPDTGIEIRDVQVAATANGRQLRTVNASTVGEIDTAFATMADQHAEALLVSSDPFFLTRRDQFAALAALDSISSFYFFILLLHSIASFYCFILLLHSIASFYCFILLLHSIASFYCFILLLHSIASFYCFILLLHSIAAVYPFREFV